MFTVAANIAIRYLVSDLFQALFFSDQLTFYTDSAQEVQSLYLLLMTHKLHTPFAVTADLVAIVVADRHYSSMWRGIADLFERLLSSFENNHWQGFVWLSLPGLKILIAAL